jgi:hypothetical protein
MKWKPPYFSFSWGGVKPGKIYSIITKRFTSIGCAAAYLLSNEERIGRKRLYATILPTLREKELIRGLVALIYWYF